MNAKSSQTIRKLSVVVPVYNERGRLGAFLERLAGTEWMRRIDHELVLVDDGSTDGSREFLQANALASATVIRRAENGGKTAAVRSGLQAASGDWVIIQDADLEYDPAEIRKLLEVVEPGTVAVYGRRPSCWFKPQRWILASGVLAVDLAIWLLHGRFVRDHATCYKLIRRDVFDQLELAATGFEGCVETTCKLIQLGHSIEQVPIRYAPRSYRDGKKLTSAHGMRAIREAWRCRSWNAGAAPAGKEAAATAPAPGPESAGSRVPVVREETPCADRACAGDAGSQRNDASSSQRSEAFLRCQRPAFTLMELMVVVGIIGVLIALLLPAVQYARESARRTNCTNRLKQIGLAFQSFHSAMGMLPSNGGPAEGNKIHSVDGEWVRPSTTEFATGITRYWGVGSTKFSPEEQPGPWSYAILPYLELGDLTQDQTYVSHVESFVCASRSRHPALPPQVDRYGRYESGGHAMAKTDYAANHRLIRNRPRVIKFHDVRDGLSQTILVGEKAFDPLVQTATSWHWDEPLWIGGAKGTARAAAKIVPDGPGIAFEDNWGSPHATGAHFVFADGHVGFVSASVQEKLLRAALTSRGGESDQLPQ